MTNRRTFTVNGGIGASVPAPISVESQNWHDVLTQFRDCLQQICESELVCADKRAQKIILGMLHCKNMTDVNAQTDRLMIRVGELLAAKTGDKTELTRLITKARERGRAALTRSSKYHAFRNDGADEQRVVIKF